MAKFMADNDIIKPKHLQFADYPSSWLGADQLSAEEVAFVWGLKGAVRVRSRQVGAC